MEVPRAAYCIVQIRQKSNVTLQNYKRGTGGRSSFSGTVATVFGASGFLGKKVVNQLGAIGCQVVIPRRGDFYELDQLKLAGDLGQILYHDYDLKDEDSIKRAMAYSNVVINCIGRNWETKNYSFDEVHVEGARRIARAAKEMGVEKLIHISSLNASPNPQAVLKRDGSDFLKSKYDGELAVREEFPEAVIIRPADMFGGNDTFIDLYVNPWRRRMGYKIPLWHKGESTIKQPVYVSDVAKGIMNAIKMQKADGQTYEAVGPTRYYLSDLVDYFWNCCRYPTVPGRVRLRSWSRFRLRAEFNEKFKFLFHGAPPYTWDKLERDHLTDRTTGCLLLEDLNVQLTPIERVAPYQLKPHIMGSYYAEKLHEYADPAPPVPTEFTPEPKGIAYTFPEVVTGLLRSSIAFEVSACVVAYYVYMTYF